VSGRRYFSSYEGGKMSAETEIQEAVSTATESTDKPAGYDPVDLSNLPEDVRAPLEDRFKYLYRQVKDNERNVREFKTIARDQSAVIEELRAGVGQVVNHITSAQSADKEAELESAMQKAFDDGDQKAYVKAQKDLIKFQTDQVVKSQPKEQVRETLGTPANARQISQDAVTDGEFSPQDAQYMQAWAEETNERGELIRPWTNNPDPQYPDPDFVKAAMIADQFYTKNPGATIQQVTAFVDQKMGIAKQSGQSVMGGNLTMPKKTNTLKLTPKQEEIAVRTKYGSNKGAKTNAEYIAAYREQLKSLQGAK
jgi:hypothetical protein